MTKVGSFFIVLVWYLPTNPLFLLINDSAVNGFVSHHHYHGYYQDYKTTKQLPLLRHSNSEKNDDIIDVDFERIYGSNTAGSGDSMNDKGETQDNNEEEQKEIDTNENSEKTLFDLSLDSADPELRDMRVPFVDEKKSGGGETFIDGNLAFMVDLDGVSYGIAVPCDHCAAIAKENLKDGTVENLSPDDAENEEIINIMAKHVIDEFNDDEDDEEKTTTTGATNEKKSIALKRTPRILTISGNLTKYTKNWETELLPTLPIEPEKLMDDSDENLDFFYDFMKSELGEKEFDKTKRQIRQQQEANGGPLDIDEDLADLFKIPGLGTEEDDVEGIKEMMSTFYDIDKEENQYPDLKDAEQFKNVDGVALKLISFQLKNGMSYSLVNMVKPYVLVGKMVMNKPNKNEVVDVEEGDYYRDNKMYNKDLYFQLLTPEEEKLVVPRLEKICQQDIEKAGLLSLTPPPK